MSRTFQSAARSLLLAGCAVVALLWSVAAHAQAEASQKEERRVALVIGNSTYETSPLKNPESDARLMAATLQELGFEVILKLNANQNEMKRAIEEFGRTLNGGGVGLFYFAGHGIQLKGRNYLIPIGANISDEGEVDIESVDVARVLAKMDSAKNRVNLVMLDACRNNPFQRSFRSVDRGLAFVSAPQGTLIAYATAPGDVAQDGAGENGTYTAALVEEMRAAPAPIEQVLKRVRSRVKEMTSGTQVPWESSSLEGEFYFRLPGDTREPAVVPVVPKPRAAPPPARKEKAGPPAVPPAHKASRNIIPDPPPDPLRTDPEYDTGTKRRSSGSTGRGLGYLSIGLGSAGLALGVTTKLLSNDTQQTLDAVCRDGQCPESVSSDVDRFKLYKTLNTAGYVAGGGLLGLGIVLVIASGDDDRSEGVHPYFDGREGGVFGRF
jgi:hypothetical protein